MVQRTVLKVDVSCLKCKKKLLKAVSALEGVDKIEVDGAKGTLTVTGNADPYEIVVKTRKAGKHAEVLSIGPPPPPQKKPGEKKPDEKKPDDKKPDMKKLEKKDQAHDPLTCPQRQRVVFVQIGYLEPSQICSIM